MSNPGKYHHKHPQMAATLKWLSRFHREMDGIVDFSPEVRRERDRKTNEKAWRVYEETGGLYGWPEGHEERIYA